MPRFLFTIGVACLIAALFWQYGEKFGLGHLPGDISFQRNNVSFHFPIVTAILISIILTILLRLFRR